MLQTRIYLQRAVPILPKASNTRRPGVLGRLPLRRQGGRRRLGVAAPASRQFGNQLSPRLSSCAIVEVEAYVSRQNLHIKGADGKYWSKKE